MSESSPGTWTEGSDLSILLCEADKKVIGGRPPPPPRSTYPKQKHDQIFIIRPFEAVYF